jgi:ABC-type transport system involved in multi-copper enzyme maturation permease subunit
MFAIAWFEFKTRLKRLSTYVYFVSFAAVAGLWMAAAGGVFQSASIVFGSEKIAINAPYALAQTITVLGLMGVVVVAAFMGRAVQQDFEYQTFHFFYTSPISKRDYYVGRFLGAAVTLLFIFTGIALGVVAGASLPGIDPARVGPWSIEAFVRPFLMMTVPNILFLGALFFGMAALGRRMLPVYIAGVVVLIGNLIAPRLLRDIDNRTLAALVDPVGVAANSLVTRYWSAAEKNSQLVPFAAEILWNRALWLGVGMAIFAFCYWRFRMDMGEEGAWRKGKKKSLLDADADPVAPAIVKPGGRGPISIPIAPLDTATGAYLRQFPALVRLYLKETIRNVYFVVLVLSGAAFILANSKVVGSQFGTNTYPVTYQVLEFASGTFALFVLIITAFYAGELVWRERDARMAQIADSLPQPTWLQFFAKLATLMLMQAVLQAVVLACGVLVQVVNGYTRFELGQYLYRLFVLQLPEYWMVAALALTVHVLVNNKYLGHFIVVLYYIAEAMAEGFGWGHRLYRFGSVPPVVYSDMNRYGNFLGPVRWFQAYWAAASVLLLVVAQLFWVRGMDTGMKIRARVARARFGGGTLATALVALAVFGSTGAWIYYNTNILNPYRTEFQQEELRARYEKAFKPYALKPQPKVVGVRVDVDIHPHEHRIAFKGTTTLKNKSGSPVPELYVNLPETAEVKKFAGSIALKLGEDAHELGWRRYSLERPLDTDETMTVEFDIDYPPRGFTSAGASRTVVDNGTFVNSSMVPSFGYEPRVELSEERERKKHGLGPRERVPDLDDPIARKRNYISSDGDWIDFEATVTTDEDQIALAPGYIQREWVEGGRRHYHYRMDVPILDFYAFLSAKWAVKKGAWTPAVTPGAANAAMARGPVTSVPIEVYYHPGHEYNVDAMIAGVKDSLDYYTRNFSPYQHRQVRILEFPRYATFAQAFPNTIPYSESIGFIARVKPDDPKDVDYPYYVTAHEIAHQWWAHQVIGGYVQGSTMMSETLAQYSALMVMKKKYGDAKMKRFLKYELDNYLSSRGNERRKEQPLFRNENQPYIHYRKGSVAMYAFQDAIGEDNVNRALAAYLKKFAYQEPPYTTSRDLLAEFRAVTPEEYQYFVTDLFETITLWENRALSATYREKGGGKYEVTLKVSAKKLRADESGRQTEIPMNDLVDIGVLGDKDEPLYLKKHRIKDGETTLTLEVAGKPVKAGIDPVVKLIDRRPDDNTIAVTTP